MNQVKDDLHLRENRKHIIIGSHARERIAERLGWSKKIYKQVVKEICLNFWDEIIDSDTEAIHIVNKGAKWIFETRGPNRVVLMTVVLFNEHPIHVKIRKLIKKFCSTGEKELREKIKREIIKLDKEAPKLVTCIDSNNRKVHSSFNIYH